MEQLDFKIFEQQYYIYKQCNKKIEKTKGTIFHKKHYVFTISHYNVQYII